MERTDYTAIESTSRRLLRQEELILDVTEALVGALVSTGTTRSQLATSLGKTKGYVSQLFSGGRNLTLRTVADVADALNQRVQFQLVRRSQSFPLAGWGSNVVRFGKKHYEDDLAQPACVESNKQGDVAA